MKTLFICILACISITSINGQDIAFTSIEKDLIPEGIAFDSITGDFYISSIYKNKIVKVSKSNEWSDFIASNCDGFVGGIGLHVDSKRRILWACSGNIMGDKYRTGVFAYDLTSNKLIKKFFIPTGTIPRIFNDLVISNEGSVYITDTFEGGIWKWNVFMEKPEKIYFKDPLKYPNGIEISPDNKYLFVTSNEGLKRFDFSNNKLDLIRMPKDTIKSKWLDGIQFYKNSIIGIQNGHGNSKIIRFYLSPEFDEVTKIELIDDNNKYFNIPTTNVIANGELYVIANSQLDNLAQKDIKIIKPEDLTPTFIIKYKLE